MEFSYYKTAWEEHKAEELMPDNIITDLEKFEEYAATAQEKFLKTHNLNKDKTNILWLARDSQGCGYVRMYLPSKYLDKSKFTSIITQVVNIDLINWADIIIWQRQHDDNLIFFNQYASIKNKIQIYELDDNFHELPSHNPAKQKITPEVLKKVERWMTVSDTIITSTDELNKYYKDEFNTIVTIPNSIEITDRKKEYLNSRVRIVWAGSPSHIEDLKIIEKVIKKLKKEYKNKIKFTMIGYKGNIHPDKYIPWIPIEDYNERLSNMNFDIGLAPVHKTKFNASKSNIKWLEYSMANIATVASDFITYQDIEQYKTGLKAQNTERDWYSKIKLLIERPDLRRQLVKNAKEKIKKDYNIENTVRQYEDLFTKLIEENK